MLISCQHIENTPSVTKTSSISKTNNSLIDYQRLMKINSPFEKSVELYAIEYTSDGLSITGYIAKPKGDSTFPAIIYNRAGFADASTIARQELNYIAQIASKGYVVLASQYRGNIFSDGKDEFGGKDINDVLNLIDLAESLLYVNKDKIGMLGFARGGMMTLKAARMNKKLKAIAVVGTPSDYLLVAQNRPKIYHTFYKKILGDIDTNKEAYIDRSANNWAEEIDTPVLLLHASNDNRVKLSHSENLAAAFKKHKIEHKLVIYEIDNGSVENNLQNLRDTELLAWFGEKLK